MDPTATDPRSGRPMEAERGEGAARAPHPAFRVGVGYDSHRFDPARPLILGGVHFPDEPGLTGVSDADAIAHAVTDAILGASGLGDIGSHFPPTDPAWLGADSLVLLESVMRLVYGRGWLVGNVDVVVVCERPKIGPRAAEIRTRLAAALGIDADLVSVKGKTNEGMGWEGRQEGIGVHSVALLYRGPAPSAP
jgi:2-C-methyl-D-erythritol 2,4-cyclodiphosphate synthase